MPLCHPMMTLHSAAAAWTPASLPSKVAWWRADLGTDTTTNGASVTTWADQFGLQAPLTGASTTKPTYATSGIGGQASLAFNGSQKMTCSDSASLRLTSSYHFFVVAKMTTENSFNTILSKVNGAFTAGWDHYIASGNIPKASHDATLVAASAASSLDPTSGAFAYEVRYNGSTTLSWFVNGTAPSPTGTGSVGPAGSDTDVMFVGQRFDGATFLTGQIAEIIITSAVIAGTDLTSLKSYLSTRYAITIV